MYQNSRNYVLAILFILLFLQIKKILLLFFDCFGVLWRIKKVLYNG
jgi:hypothetical protein